MYRARVADFIDTLKHKSKIATHMLDQRIRKKANYSTKNLITKHLIIKIMH